ncbi:MAG: hypothetical protein WCK78_00500 [Paludibacter sp.]
MKQLFIVLTAVILTVGVFAQAPQKLSYQAVVRNSSSQLVVNTKIAMKVSVLQGSAIGAQVYTETLTPTTNANGLVSFEFGSGIAFQSIEWASGPYFLKTETDPAGGSNYSIVGTSQLLSTPYALYAAKAGNGFSGSYLDLTNKPTLSTVAASGSYSDLISRPTFAAVATSGSYADLANKPTLFSGVYADLTNKPTLSTVASTGSYSDLISRPTFAAVATSGSYVDLLNKPALFSGIYADLTAKPVLSTVATSGSYADLLNKPSLFSGVYADLTAKPVLFSGSYADLTNKPTYATVATTGSYADLLNKPTLFSGSYVDLTNKPTFATIATTGSFADLQNKPLLVSTATAPAAGDILYYNGTAWLLLNKGTDAQVLKLETGLPKWKNLSDYGSVIPAAIFSVSQLIGTTVQSITVDASAVVDDVDAPTALQVRWKWEDTGTATAWTTTKTATYTYTTEGAKNITLEVKDSQGNIGTSSKAIVINNTLFSPMVSTAIASNITGSTFTIGGSVIANGASTVTAYGVCWATTQNPTIAASKTTDGTGLGSFTSSISGLIAGTTYYVRAYATNSTTTSYGNQVTVATPLTVLFPTVTTTAATNIATTSAATGGNVTSTGGATVTERGVCWSATNQNPTIADNKTSDGTGSGTFVSQITGIPAGWLIYARAFATNSAGISYGSSITINAAKTVPVLTTKTFTDISAMGGVSGGIISSDGGNSITERGICWSESPNASVSDNKIVSPASTASFGSAITQSKPSTTYYVRAYATNSVGTGYGDEKSFTTLDAQYYQSFETGLLPSGWSGDFKVNSESAFDGSYSLKSLDNTSCNETLSITLTAAGQISFYYSFYGCSGNIDIYIDDVSVKNFPYNGGGWQQGLVNVTAGTRKIKWVYNYTYPYSGCTSKCYIDHIVITK